MQSRLPALESYKAARQERENWKQGHDGEDKSALPTKVSESSEPAHADNDLAGQAISKVSRPFLVADSVLKEITGLKLYKTRATLNKKPKLDTQAEEAPAKRQV